MDRLTKEMQHSVNHTATKPFAIVFTKSCSIGSHEVDAIESQPRLRKFAQEFVDFLLIETPLKLSTHFGERFQLAVPGSFLQAIIGSRTLKQVSEFGGRMICVVAMSRVDPQKRRRHKYCDDAFFQGLDVAKVRRECLHQSNNRLQFAVLHIAPPRSCGDRAKNSIVVLCFWILTQQSRLSFRRPDLINRAFDFGAEQARTRYLPETCPVVPTGHGPGTAA